MCRLQARTSALGTVIQPMIFSPLEWRHCMSLLSGPRELCFWLQTSATLTLMQHSLECLTVVPSPQVLSLNHTAISSENLCCVVIESLSRVQLFATPWTAARQVSLSFAISWSLLKLKSIESVMPSNHLILCPPLLPCLQSFPASGSFPMSCLFASGGPNYWSFSIGAENLWHRWIWLGNLGFLEESLYGDFRVFSPVRSNYTSHFPPFFCSFS